MAYGFNPYMKGPNFGEFGQDTANNILQWLMMKNMMGGQQQQQGGAMPDISGTGVGGVGQGMGLQLPPPVTPGQGAAGGGFDMNKLMMVLRAFGIMK